MNYKKDVIFKSDNKLYFLYTNHILEDDISNIEEYSGNPIHLDDLSIIHRYKLIYKLGSIIDDIFYFDVYFEYGNDFITKDCFTSNWIVYRKTENLIKDYTIQNLNIIYGI